MFRPRFEDPIDSAKDMVEKNITLIDIWHQYPFWKQILLSVNSSEWTQLAENMVPMKSWDEFEYYHDHYVQGNRTSGGTHAFLGTSLNDLPLNWLQLRSGGNLMRGCVG